MLLDIIQWEDWTTGQRQTIINRMGDMNYQSKNKRIAR